MQIGSRPAPGLNVRNSILKRIPHKVIKENSLRRHGKGGILGMLRLALTPATRGSRHAQHDRIADCCLSAKNCDVCAGLVRIARIAGFCAAPPVLDFI